MLYHVRHVRTLRPPTLYWEYWSTKHWARSVKASLDALSHQSRRLPHLLYRRPAKERVYFVVDTYMET